VECAEGDSMKKPVNDFSIFKEECKKWIAFFGLSQWDITFEYGKVGDGNVAETSFDATNHWALITLSNTVESDDLCRSAFHEVDEVRYALLRSLACERYTTYREIDGAVHEMIRQDENLIYQPTS
jgi:hypothetical protein